MTDEHLGYRRHEAGGCGNDGNGHGSKRVLAGKDSVRIEVPRDRNSALELQFVTRRQTRLPGFD